MSAVNMLIRRLRLLVDRTLLTRVAYKGAIRVLQLQAREGLALDNIEHLEAYGHTSHPLPGAEAVVLNLGGNRSRAVVVMVNDRRHRFVLAEGESAIYTHNGDFVHIKSDGEIHVKASTRVLMETPLVEMTQDLLVRGNAHIEGDMQIDGNSTVAENSTVGGNHSVGGTSHGTGSITTDGDVGAGSISLRNHRHGGVDTGSGISGVAQ